MRPPLVEASAQFANKAQCLMWAIQHASEGTAESAAHEVVRSVFAMLALRGITTERLIREGRESLPAEG